MPTATAAMTGSRIPKARSKPGGGTVKRNGSRGGRLWPMALRASDASGQVLGPGKVILPEQFVRIFATAGVWDPKAAAHVLVDQGLIGL